ncbi:MAG: hypothetical protein K2L19_02780 [Eubacterium sp.]|nr:hypothetical protein [Eubacterium sp.]
MKQSDRIRYCKEYHNHPLRKEYELKKSKFRKKPLPFCMVFPWIMIIVYLLIFIGCVKISKIVDNSFPFVIAGYAIIIIGLINLYISFQTFRDALDLTSRDLETDDLKKLREEYEKKGLIEWEEHELWKHECCEYDDYREMYVCCATKQPLSYRDISFCKQPGNCKYCKAFVTAYLGPDGPKYWSYEFKR